MKAFIYLLVLLSAACFSSCGKTEARKKPTDQELAKAMKTIEDIVEKEESEKQEIKKKV